MRTNTGLSRLVVAVLAGTAIVAGCSVSGSRGPIETPPSVASPTASSPNAEAVPSCFDRPVHVEQGQNTVAYRAGFSQRVLVVTFQGYVGPQYATVDGTRVKKKDLDEQVELIFRRVNLSPVVAIRGAFDSGGQISARVMGGEIGCDHNVFDNDPALTKGQDYLVFLGPNSDPKRPPILAVAWPVTGGKVKEPDGGVYTLDEVRSIVEKNPCEHSASCSWPGANRSGE